MSFLRLFSPVLFAAVVGCSGDGLRVGPSPVVHLNPAAITLAVGDSTTLTVTELDAQSRVRISSNAPHVASVDSSTVSGVAVVVRGRAAGAAVLSVTVLRPEPVVAAIPVTVQ